MTGHKICKSGFEKEEEFM